MSYIKLFLLSNISLVGFEVVHASSLGRCKNRWARENQRILGPSRKEHQAIVDSKSPC